MGPQIQTINRNTDYLLEVARGNIEGASFINKFGQNSDLASGVEEDIWDVGDDVPYPADGTAPITHLDSDNAADTMEIDIQGLDINGAFVQQLITLTGTTPVPLTTPLWRIFRMLNNNNVDVVGNVQAIDVGDVVKYAQIQGDNNQTLMAIYTIPAGCTGFFLKGSAGLGGVLPAYDIDGKAFVRDFGKVWQVKHTFALGSNGTSFIQQMFPVALPISEKSDIRFSAISSRAGGIVNVTFDILLLDN